MYAANGHMDARREKFITATEELVDTLTSVVKAGRKELERVGGLQFSLISPIAADAKGIRQLIRPPSVGYWKWFNTVGVSTRSEMEQLWKSFGDEQDILKIVEQLRAAEKRFNELIEEADADVQRNEDKVLITKYAIVRWRYSVIKLSTWHIDWTKFVPADCSN